MGPWDVRHGWLDDGDIKGGEGKKGVKMCIRKRKDKDMGMGQATWSRDERKEDEVEEKTGNIKLPWTGIGRIHRLHESCQKQEQEKKGQEQEQVV